MAEATTQTSNGKIRLILLRRAFNYGLVWLLESPEAIKQGWATQDDKNMLQKGWYAFRRLSVVAGIGCLGFILGPWDAEWKTRRGVSTLKETFLEGEVQQAIWDLSMRIELWTIGGLSLALILNKDLNGWLQKASAFLSTKDPQVETSDEKRSLPIRFAKTTAQYVGIALGVGALSTTATYAGKHERNLRTGITALGLGVAYGVFNSYFYSYLGWVSTWSFNAAEGSLLKYPVDAVLWLFDRELFWWSIVIGPWLPGFQSRYVKAYKKELQLAAHDSQQANSEVMSTGSLDQEAANLIEATSAPSLAEDQSTELANTTVAQTDFTEPVQAVPATPEQGFSSDDSVSSSAPSPFRGPVPLVPKTPAPNIESSDGSDFTVPEQVEDGSQSVDFTGPGDTTPPADEPTTDAQQNPRGRDS